MNTLSRLALLVAIVATHTTAPAQFVKANEAVKLVADGSKKVETPPLPATGPIRSTRQCNASDGCHAGPWHMVETNEGLQECTEAYARPGTCRKSTYGSTKASRIWVVRSKGAWLQCQFPDLSSKCVDMAARPPANLPFDAVQ